jgi:hypothetical protein
VCLGDARIRKEAREKLQLPTRISKNAKTSLSISLHADEQEFLSERKTSKKKKIGTRRPLSWGV